MGGGETAGTGGERQGIFLLLLAGSDHAVSSHGPVWASSQRGSLSMVQRARWRMHHLFQLILRSKAVLFLPHSTGYKWDSNLARFKGKRWDCISCWGVGCGWAKRTCDDGASIVREVSLPQSKVSCVRQTSHTRKPSPFSFLRYVNQAKHF